MPSDNQLWQAQDRLIAEFEDIVFSPVIDQILMPNGVYDTPNDGNWVRVNPATHLALVDSDSNRCYEVNRAQMQVDVFVPKKTGSTQALKWGEQIKSAFIFAMLDDMIVESATIDTLPEPSDSPWFGVGVKITFTYEGYNT